MSQSKVKHYGCSTLILAQEKMKSICVIRNGLGAVANAANSLFEIHELWSANMMHSPIQSIFYIQVIETPRTIDIATFEVMWSRPDGCSSPELSQPWR